MDYIDADNIPTSDVAAASWNTTTTHPTYTGNEKTPYIDSAKDRFGRNHYEETNSTGPNTARTILDGMKKLLNELR